MVYLKRCLQKNLTNQQFGNISLYAIDFACFSIYLSEFQQSIGQSAGWCER